MIEKIKKSIFPLVPLWILLLTACSQRQEFKEQKLPQHSPLQQTSWFVPDLKYVHALKEDRKPYILQNSEIFEVLAEESHNGERWLILKISSSEKGKLPARLGRTTNEFLEALTWKRSYLEQKNTEQ